MFLNHKIQKHLFFSKILHTNIKYYKLFSKLKFIIKIKQT